MLGFILLGLGIITEITRDDSCHWAWMLSSGLMFTGIYMVLS